MRAASRPCKSGWVRPNFAATYPPTKGPPTWTNIATQKYPDAPYASRAFAALNKDITAHADTNCGTTYPANEPRIKADGRILENTMPLRNVHWGTCDIKRLGELKAWLLSDPETPLNSAPPTRSLPAPQ